MNRLEHDSNPLVMIHAFFMIHVCQYKLIVSGSNDLAVTIIMDYRYILDVVMNVT